MSKTGWREEISLLHPRKSITLIKMNSGQPRGRSAGSGVRPPSQKSSGARRPSSNASTKRKIQPSTSDLVYQAAAMYHNPESFSLKDERAIILNDEEMSVTFDRQRRRYVSFI